MLIFCTLNTGLDCEHRPQCSHSERRKPIELIISNYFYLEVIVLVAAGVICMHTQGTFDAYCQCVFVFVFDVDLSADNRVSFYSSYKDPLMIDL